MRRKVRRDAAPANSVWGYTGAPRSKPHTHVAWEPAVERRRITTRTFFFAGSVTPVTMRLSSLRMAFAATPVVADLKSWGELCHWGPHDRRVEAVAVAACDRVGGSLEGGHGAGGKEYTSREKRPEMSKKTDRPRGVSYIPRRNKEGVVGKVDSRKARKAADEEGPSACSASQSGSGSGRRTWQLR